MRITKRLSIKIAQSKIPEFWQLIDIGYITAEEPNTGEPMIVFKCVFAGLGIAILYITKEYDPREDGLL